MSKNENRGRVVHCKRESFDVYIGRPSKWGNPFKVGKGDPGSRLIAISKYEEWVKTQPELMAALPELKGKTLGCWCHPLQCHGDVLVRLANEGDRDPRYVSEPGFNALLKVAQANESERE